MATLQIPLEDLRGSAQQALYVGDRSRLATSTSVRIVDPRTIVCCSLLARKIYLVRFDLGAGSHAVIDSADTTYAGNTSETDLCDIDGQGHVLTSNCEAASMSLYRLVDDKIRYVRDLPAGLAGNFCHGARFCGPGVFVTTTLRDPMGAHFFDAQTLKKLLYIKMDHPTRDICFLAANRAALIATAGTPRSVSYMIGASEIVVVEFDLGRGTHRFLSRQPCGVGQIDSIVHHDGRLYVADSYGGCVRVVDALSLRQVDQIDGYDFPHGIDVNHGMLAVACYGTNAIHVSSLPA